MRIIAYTYDADYHCLGCTADRFNKSPDHRNTVVDAYYGTDSEGNEIHPVFDIDEWYANDLYEKNDSATLVCGTCLEIIEEVDLSE